MNPTTEQIAKLPKWAQDHIARIERRRADAVRQLEEYCDTVTPSPIKFDNWRINDGEKVKYIQADEITFQLAERRSISVRIDEGQLRLMGTGDFRGLFIKPHVSNVVMVGVYE